jgi:hypothetical protein
MAGFTIARLQEPRLAGVLILTRRDTEALNTVATNKQALLREASDNINAL